MGKEKLKDSQVSGATQSSYNTRWRSSKEILPNFKIIGVGSIRFERKQKSINETVNLEDNHFTPIEK